MASEPDAVELAIWFHDVVYDPKSKLNEEKSSKFWSVYAAGYGVPEAMVQKVAKLILATKHEAVAPVSPDAALLVDIDLAILGQPADVFERYEAQVREEYNWVPDREFAEGRSAVMKMFLDREFIYFTPDLRHRYEVQARTNLAKSIACWDMVSHIIQSSLAARSL
jgi:predicted metal-dependent HD superfamily phosphohydrolase